MSVAAAAAAAAVVGNDDDVCLIVVVVVVVVGIVFCVLGGGGGGGGVFLVARPHQIHLSLDTQVQSLSWPCKPHTFHPSGSPALYCKAPCISP